MGVGAAIGVSAAAGLAGSAISAGAAKSAASQQANAATAAANLQESQYQQTRSDLLPYNTAGQAGLPALQAQAGQTASALGTAFGNAQGAIPQQITAQNINQLPGYQFNLSQGLNAVQNSAAGRGLGVSSTAFNNASNFATGLANQYATDYFNRGQQIYNDQSQQFANANTGATTVYNQLYGPAALGENAAAQSGAIGQAGAAAAGTQIAAAGQAQAAGTSAAANAVTNGLNTLGSAPLQYLALSNVLNSGNGLGSSGGGLGSNGWGAGSTGTQPFGSGNTY